MACCQRCAPSISCCCPCVSCLPQRHQPHTMVLRLELFTAGAGQHPEHGFCGGALLQRAGCAAGPCAASNLSCLGTGCALSLQSQHHLCTAVQAMRAAGTLSMGSVQRRHMISRSVCTPCSMPFCLPFRSPASSWRMPSGKLCTQLPANCLHRGFGSHTSPHAAAWTVITSFQGRPVQG